MNATGPRPDQSFSHCHVPADFDPDGQVALKTAVNRLIGAAQWLAAELEQGRGCHAALLQASILQVDLDKIHRATGGRHLKSCVARAIGGGQSPDEVQALLMPIQTLLLTR